MHVCSHHAVALTLRCCLISLVCQLDKAWSMLEKARSTLLFGAADILRSFLRSNCCSSDDKFRKISWRRQRCRLWEKLEKWDGSAMEVADCWMGAAESSLGWQRNISCKCRCRFHLCIGCVESVLMGESAWETEEHEHGMVQSEKVSWGITTHWLLQKCNVGFRMVNWEDVRCLSTAAPERLAVSFWGVSPMCIEKQMFEESEAYCVPCCCSRQ